MVKLFTLYKIYQIKLLVSYPSYIFNPVFHGFNKIISCCILRRTCKRWSSSITDVSLPIISIEILSPHILWYVRFDINVNSFDLSKSNYIHTHFNHWFYYFFYLFHLGESLCNNFSGLWHHSICDLSSDKVRTIA